MNVTDFRDIYAHMEWAESRVWAGVLSTDASKGDVALLEKLRHIHRTQQFFLKVWRAEPIEFTKFEGTLDDEYTLMRKYYADIQQFFDGITDADLDRDASVPWADRFAQRVGRDAAEKTTLRQTLYQAAAHSNYHRGQANTRLRELGIEPPLVDYIAWLWLGRPSAAWG
jgi:uncharacterized damage-inducible protein DinB